MSHEVRNGEEKGTFSDARLNARSGCGACRHQNDGWRHSWEVKP
jgi:hypothetical protein